MYFKFYTLSALLLVVAIGASAQSFLQFEGLSNQENRWLLKFSNSSNGSNSTNGNSLCNGNSTLCEIGEKRFGKGIDQQEKQQQQRQEDEIKIEKIGASTGKYWYENVPIPPIVVATSDSLPDGACKRQLNRYIEELRNGTMWATMMFDASAKYPYGVIDGQMIHLGSFDQCLRIEAKLPGSSEDVKGRYCLVDFKYEQRDASPDFQSKLGYDFDPNDSVWEAIREQGDFRRRRRYEIEMALCIPSVCSAEDVQQALQGPYADFGVKNNLIVKVSVEKKNCQAYHEQPAFSTGAKIFCSVLLGIFSLVVVSSLYDSTLTTEEEKIGTSFGRQLLLCFSAKRNVRTVFEVTYKHRGLDTIHMIRFFSMCLVLVGHRAMQFYMNPVVNQRYLEMTYSEPSLVVLHNGPIIVDGFFGIGGLLTCFGLLCQFDKTKRMNFIGLTIIRFLRFTPAYALLIFFTAYVFPLLGSGPNWQATIGAEADNCAATWWANLFYLNNYLTMDRLCIFQSWYLSVDFHCYLMAVFLIYVFWKCPRNIGYSILGGFTFASMVMPFFLSYSYRLQPLFYSHPSWKDITYSTYFLNYYVKSHLRITAYMVGVISGAIIYDYQKATWRISKRWSQGLFILLVVFLSIYSQSLGFQFYNPALNTTNLEKGLYACLHRGAFALSFCSIVILITMGDGLDFHYNFLTPRWVQPLGRLTYSVFLVHNAIQRYHVGIARSARTFSINSAFWDFIPDVTYSFFLALIVAIGIEGPFRKMEKHFIMKREKVQTISSGSDEQTEKVEAKKID